jgi:hypothetical protein
VGARFSALPLGPALAPVHWVPLLGGKADGAWLEPPTPSSAEVKKKVISVFLLPFVLSWLVVG